MGPRVVVPPRLGQQVDERHLGPRGLRAPEDDRVAGAVPEPSAPCRHHHDGRCADERDPLPRAERDRDREHEQDPVGPRDRGHRDDRGRGDVMAVLDEHERPHRRREEDRRRVDHREEERRGEQCQRPHGEHRRLRGSVTGRDAVHAGERDEQHELVEDDRDGLIAEPDLSEAAHDAGEQGEERPPRLQAPHRQHAVPVARDRGVPHAVPHLESAELQAAVERPRCRGDDDARAHEPRDEPRKDDRAPREQPRSCLRSCRRGHHFVTMVPVQSADAPAARPVVGADPRGHRGPRVRHGRYGRRARDEVLSADDAVLEPPATPVVETLQPVQGCRALLDTGRGDCTVVRAADADLVVTVEPGRRIDDILVTRPWTVRVYRPAPGVPDGWELALATRSEDAADRPAVRGGHGEGGRRHGRRSGRARRRVPVGGDRDDPRRRHRRRPIPAAPTASSPTTSSTRAASSSATGVSSPGHPSTSGPTPTAARRGSSARSSSSTAAPSASMRAPARARGVSTSRHPSWVDGGPPVPSRRGAPRLLVHRQRGALGHGGRDRPAPAGATSRSSPPEPTSSRACR